jgi:hypothetical protein
MSSFLFSHAGASSVSLPFAPPAYAAYINKICNIAVFYNSHRLKEVNLEAKMDTGRHTEQTFCNPLPLSLRFNVTNRLDMSMLLASNWQLQAIPHTDFQINRESICTWIVVILFATPHSATKCCSKKATIRIRAFLFHKDHKWCHFVGG